MRRHHSAAQAACAQGGPSIRDFGIPEAVFQEAETSSKQEFGDAFGFVCEGLSTCSNGFC